jgi:hypothetical protein
LARQAVDCLFDSKISGIMCKSKYELLDPTHPLIQWIRYKYEPESSSDNLPLMMQPVSAIKLSIKQTDLKMKTGIYIYLIHRWKFEGLRTEIRLSYKVIRLEDSQEVNNDFAEDLINKAAIQGEYKPNVINLLDIEKIMKIYEQCENILREKFASNEIQFEAENTDKCNTQASSVKAYAERKRQQFEERIERFKAEGKTSIIPAIAGQIGKNTQDLNVALKKIDEKRKINTSNPALAAGIIILEN